MLGGLAASDLHQGSSQGYSGRSNNLHVMSFEFKTDQHNGDYTFSSMLQLLLI